MRGLVGISAASPVSGFLHGGYPAPSGETASQSPACRRHACRRAAHSHERRTLRKARREQDEQDGLLC
jgi:hypothetical protein